MKQKDLITYGLIGLAIVFIMNQGKDDDKKDEPAVFTRVKNPMREHRQPLTYKNLNNKIISS